VRRLVASLLVLSFATATTLVRADASDRRVKVWIVADAPVTLERRPSKPEGSWESICKAPCGKGYETGWEYRLVGEGILPSRPFEIGGQGNEVTLRAETISESRRTAGYILMPLGAVTAVVGTWLGIRALNGDTGNGERSATGTTVGYFALAAVGVGLVVTGVLLLGSHTPVEIEKGDVRKPLESGISFTPQGIVF